MRVRSRFSGCCWWLRLGVLAAGVLLWAGGCSRQAVPLRLSPSGEGERLWGESSVGKLRLRVRQVEADELRLSGSKAESKFVAAVEEGRYVVLVLQVENTGAEPVNFSLHMALLRGEGAEVRRMLDFTEIFWEAREEFSELGPLVSKLSLNTFRLAPGEKVERFLVFSGLSLEMKEVRLELPETLVGSEFYDLVFSFTCRGVAEAGRGT